MYVISRPGSFDFARMNTIRLIVHSHQAGPHTLTQIARAMRDVHDGLRPFTLTNVSAHAIMLDLEAGHSTRYERGQLVEAAGRHAQALVASFAERLAPSLEAGSVSAEQIGL
jgi:hypothetical protein